MNLFLKIGQSFKMKKSNEKDLKKLEHNLKFKIALTPRVGFLGKKRDELKNSLSRVRGLISAIYSHKIWCDRTELVFACNDRHNIKSVPGAGNIIGNNQIMHNGLKVTLGSYFHAQVHSMLKATKGIHEPQEEYVFQETLKWIPEGGTMLELGSYWAFYSMCFKQSVKNATCYMVEPEIDYLNIGRLNFALNNMEGTFIRGFLGSTYKKRNLAPPLLTIDHIVEENNIEHIDILHSDIQGFEGEMLQGAEHSLKKRMIDYIFVSTHNDKVHEECLGSLKAHNYDIIAEHTLAESYSVDGLIVGRRKELKGLKPLTISKKPTN